MFGFPKGDIVIFDFEWTSWPGSMAFNFKRPHEHRELVQIGAVLTEAETGKVPIKKSFESMIVPRFNPRLSDYFVGLTGITQEKVDTEGVPFPHALSKFYKFCKGLTCWSVGKDDAVVLDENCKIWDINCPFFGPETFFDIRDRLIAQGILAEKYNSGNLTEIFGEPSVHPRHQGIADVLTVVDALRMLAEGKNIVPEAKK